MGVLRPDAAYAENSIAGFQAALAAGADGIELDVQLTLDGEAVVHHDPELGRTTESSVSPGRLIWQLPLKQVQSAALRGSGGGETVPTLAEVLSAIPDGTDAPTVWIELKRQADRQRGKALVEAVLDHFADKEWSPRVWLLSFGRELLAHARTKRSDAQLIAIAALGVPTTISYASRVGIDGVGVFHRLLIQPVRAAVRRRGLVLATGMPNSSREIRRALRRMPDFICTDETELALRLRAEISS